jgi:hypothetical protein
MQDRPGRRLQRISTTSMPTVLAIEGQARSSSFLRRVAPSLREKVLDGGPPAATEQAPGQGLGAGDDLVNGSDTNLAAVELDHDIAAAVETDRLAELGRQAETPGLGDAPTHWTHG